MRSRTSPLLVGAIVVLLMACGDEVPSGVGAPDDSQAVIPTTTPDDDEPGTDGTGVDGNPDANDADDLDQDGRVVDNCPNVFNPDQADDDGDGVGNQCDEAQGVDDLSQCGLGQEVGMVAATLSGNSGDDENTPTCIAAALISGGSSGAPNVPGDRILFEFGDLVIADLTPLEIEELRNQGVRIVTVERFPELTVTDLIERRILVRPHSALDTVDLDLLSTVDPSVLSDVPDDELADLPDETLAALPESFWMEASDSTIAAIGEQRIVEIDPSIVQLAPERFELSPGVIGDSLPVADE